MQISNDLFLKISQTSVDVDRSPTMITLEMDDAETTCCCSSLKSSSTLSKDGYNRNLVHRVVIIYSETYITCSAVQNRYL